MKRLILFLALLSNVTYGADTPTVLIQGREENGRVRLTIIKDDNHRVTSILLVQGTDTVSVASDIRWEDANNDWSEETTVYVNASALQGREILLVDDRRVKNKFTLMSTETVGKGLKVDFFKPIK